MSRQRLGQHFLVQRKTLERIALAACGTHTPLAVEIGPGRGALTEHLLLHADRVAAIELDRELAAHLAARWRDDARLRIVEGDALAVDWAQWGEGVLAGNLPYYVATAIIEKYVRAPGLLRHAVFLIQKEVAERITAAPGGREYGYLSVLCQFFAEAEYLFKVPPGAFQPPPKVDSAVIRLTPRLELAGSRCRPFSAIRLQPVSGKNARRCGTNVAGVSETFASRRAEQLSLAEFVEMFRSSRATP